MELGVNNILILVALTVVPTALVSWATTWWIRFNAERLGLVDQPGERKVHQTPTPLGGGIGIWAGIVVIFAAATIVVLLREQSWIQSILPEFAVRYLDGFATKLDSLWVLLGAGTLLALVGLADDRWNIGWQWRLGA